MDCGFGADCDQRDHAFGVFHDRRGLVHAEMARIGLTVRANWRFGCRGCACCDDDARRVAKWMDGPKGDGGCGRRDVRLVAQGHAADHWDRDGGVSPFALDRVRVGNSA